MVCINHVATFLLASPAAHAAALAIRVDSAPQVGHRRCYPRQPSCPRHCRNSPRRACSGLHCLSLSYFSFHQLKLTGKTYITKTAYIYGTRPSTSPRIFMDVAFGTHKSRNKVKIFAWLYSKDRLSTRSKLFAKHFLEDDICRRCSHHVDSTFCKSEM